MKKIGILMMAMILALSALGVSYAIWQQTLTVNGKVNTGTYIVKFGTPIPSPTSTGTNTAYLGVENGASNTGFTVDVTNAYPGFTGTVTVPITIDGTIPVQLDDIKLTSNSGTEFHHFNHGSLNKIGIPICNEDPAYDLEVYYDSPDGISNYIGHTLPNRTYTITLHVTMAESTPMSVAGAHMNGVFRIDFITEQSPVH
jgi:hypothetical protein